MVRKTKIINCTNCSKIIETDNRCSAKRCFCKECRILTKGKWKNNKCKFCGRENCDKINYLCKKPVFRKALVKIFGFNPSFLKTEKAFAEYERVKNDFKYKYFILKRSLADLSKECNYKHPEALNKFLHILEIKAKSYSEARIDAIWQGKINFYKDFFKAAWHTTWDNKNVYLRSSYELNYAKQLDKLKILYEVEKIKIKYFDTEKQKLRLAIVDFYLPGENLLVEIKSNYTLNIKQMLNRARQYITQGYNFKLLLDGSEYDYNWLVNQQNL